MSGDPISFFVPGRPKSTQTGSTITVRGRSFPMRRGTAWSSVCGLYARQHAPAQPITGPVACFLTFIMPRPKKLRHRVPISRPDLENMAKGLLDSWNGVLWDDDSQVVTLLLDKLYAEDDCAPGVRVVVAPATPSPIYFFGSSQGNTTTGALNVPRGTHPVDNSVDK